MNKTLLTLAIGVGLGILLAPDKGSETIKKLKRRLNDYKDQAGDAAEDFADRAGEAFASTRSRMESTFD